MRVFFTGIQAFGEGKDAPARYVSMSNIFNARLAGRDYGPGLDTWFLLFVFQRDEPDSPRGKERMRYKPATNELDLRLFADHEAWRKARRDGDESEQYQLLYDVARRSFGIMRAKKVRNFDVDAFERDVEAIAHEQGWVRSSLETR